MSNAGHLRRQDTTVSAIALALSHSALILRGGFNFAPGEAAPPGLSGAPARSVILVGNAGAAYWRHLNDWRSRQRADLAHPLDTWSREVTGGVAQQFGARAVSPSDPCLKACPVDAYTMAGLDHKACLGHVRGAAGRECRAAGCFDRNACPHGAAFRYPAEMQAFHMASFAPVDPADLEDRRVSA